MLKIKDYISGKPDPILFIFHDSEPADCVEEVVNTKTKEILYQKVSLSPRPPPRIILKDTWQVQLEDSHQLCTSTARPVAEEEKTELKIDLRIQGIPQAAVEQEDERTREVRRSVHLKNHPNKDALTADMQKYCTYNPCSEESKKIFHNLGNVECFELCEMSSKCSNCSLYWAQCIVCCTCGTCLIPTEYTRRLTKEKFDALSIPNFLLF